MFYLVGMGFGCSYSLVQVDCIDWVKTSLPKRLVRGIIGCCLGLGVYLLCLMFSLKDAHVTEYVVTSVVPLLVIPFFTYGPFLILCQKIGLVDQQTYQYDQ